VGGESIAVHLDLADDESVRALVDTTIAQYGAVHGLVNVGADLSGTRGGIGGGPAVCGAGWGRCGSGAGARPIVGPRPGGRLIAGWPTPCGVPFKSFRFPMAGSAASVKVEREC
jgi:hypothetical protein